MAVANELRKESFRLLKKNFLLSNKLYKIFNKNIVKLSYSRISNVTNLINKSNSKKLKNKQHTEFPNCINGMSIYPRMYELSQL